MKTIILAILVFLFGCTAADKTTTIDQHQHITHSEDNKDVWIIRNSPDNSKTFATWMTNEGNTKVVLDMTCFHRDKRLSITVGAYVGDIGSDNLNGNIVQDDGYPIGFLTTSLFKQTPLALNAMMDGEHDNIFYLTFLDYFANANISENQDTKNKIFEQAFPLTFDFQTHQTSIRFDVNLNNQAQQMMRACR